MAAALSISPPSARKRVFVAVLIYRLAFSEEVALASAHSRVPEGAANQKKKWPDEHGQIREDRRTTGWTTVWVGEDVHAGLQPRYATRDYVNSIQCDCYKHVRVTLFESPRPRNIILTGLP
jgi:hypothetical protein